MAREWGPPQHHANPPMEKPSASTSWQGLASNSISSIVDYLRGTGKTNPPATATNSSYTLADGYITGVPMYVNGPDGNNPAARTEGEPPRNVDGKERDSVEITRKTVHREKYKKKPDAMEEDYDLLHLQSLLPFIKQIRDDQKLDCRNKIQQIVQWYVYCAKPCEDGPPDPCQTLPEESRLGEKGQDRRQRGSPQCETKVKKQKPPGGSIDNRSNQSKPQPRRHQDTNQTVPNGNSRSQTESYPGDNFPPCEPDIPVETLPRDHGKFLPDDFYEREDKPETGAKSPPVGRACPEGYVKKANHLPFSNGNNFDYQQRNSTGRRGKEIYPPNYHSDSSNYQYQQQFSPSRQYSYFNNPGQAQNTVSRRPDVPDYHYQQQRGPNNGQQQMQRSCVPIRNQLSPNMYCPP